MVTLTEFLFKLTFNLSFSTSQTTPNAFESGIGSEPIAISEIFVARSHLGISERIDLALELATHFLSI